MVGKNTVINICKKQSNENHYYSDKSQSAAVEQRASQYAINIGKLCV